jgi:NADH-quinone oxidoreductase subunit M
MIADFGGLSKVMPVFAAVFMIMTLSSIGMPVLNGFVGEFSILLGAFRLTEKYWAILAATGIVLGAAYMLWLYQRTMFGKLDNPENEKLTDMTFRELATLLPLVVLAFWIGVYPKPFFAMLDEPVHRLVQQVEKTYAYPRTASTGGGAGASPAAALVSTGE